ncbi:Lysyl oxidase-like 2B [Exaiptasia diaphana]|nr:Lysyl oxidase-like 2B [Exaiptasia diaphana]
MNLERCTTNLNGDSGELSINETYLRKPSNCSWTIGEGRSDINFIVIKFEPFDLGDQCFEDQDVYVEVADVNHEFKVKECGGGRSFEVLIKRRSAVVRFYSESGYHTHCGWYDPYCTHDTQNIRLSFHVISKKLAGLTGKKWKPTTKQQKPGEITIDWDQSTLPSNSYIVVPLYNFTTKEEPLLYIIEHRNDTSIAVEYLKPATLYTFKIVAFDPTNTTESFIESCTSSIKMKTDSIRLIGGTLSNEGRVEVFKDGLWNEICLHRWSWHTKNANAVCRSFGLPDISNVLHHGEFLGSSFPIQMLEFQCNETATTLEECLKDTQSACKGYGRQSSTRVICGHPPVFHQNITKMTGVITSPGYPSFMMQADYRWIFMPNLTRGRVALYFDVLDLRRGFHGDSSVYIQDVGKVYRNRLYDGVTTVLSSPGQLKFYSSFSTRRLIINRQYGKGMRVKYFSYNEPVPLLNNWTISLSSYNYNRITANWTQINVRGYGVFGFLISCNSTQDWANEAVYGFGESNSTSATCKGLIGYTNYDVYVLVMLKNEETGTCTAYKSLMASTKTPESSPSVLPQRVYSTDITPNSAVIGWKPLQRKDTHGVLLGYTVKLYRDFTDTYDKEIKTNDTSVVFKDLSPANEYKVEIRGYTAAGTGPYAYRFFSTSKHIKLIAIHRMTFA